MKEVIHNDRVEEEVIHIKYKQVRLMFQDEAGFGRICMNVFLKELSAYYPEDYIILVTDRASWHTANDLVIPNNIEIIYLPPAIAYTEMKVYKYFTRILTYDIQQSAVIAVVYPELAL